MSSHNKYIFLFVFGLLITLFPATKAIASIEFYLLDNDAQHKVDCDFLKITNNQALCTANNLLITYDLAKIKTIEVVDKGITSSFLLFTQETRKIINGKNSAKKNKQNGRTSEKFKQIKLTPNNFGIDFLLGLTGQLTTFFYHPLVNASVFTIISIIGLIILLVGSLGFLIAAFRAGILWGLSCMFLPLASIVFLFVHWKMAAKPFLLSLLGIAILFIDPFLAATSQKIPTMSKNTPPIARNNLRTKNVRFQCRGKIYCSEMSSCAEATFYLRNCPGTKMDGNNDGVPCEKQWCGH